MIMMSAGEVQGFVCALGRSIHRVCTFALNYCNTRNQRTANEWEDNQKVWMGKNLIDPGYDLGGGGRIPWT